MKAVLDKLDEMVVYVDSDHYEFTEDALRQSISEMEFHRNVIHSMVGQGGSGTSAYYRWSQPSLELAAESYLDRIAGMSHRNIYVKDIVFDEDTGLVTGKVIELYDTKANAQAHDGSTGLLSTLTYTFTYTGTQLASVLVYEDLAS